MTTAHLHLAIAAAPDSRPTLDDLRPYATCTIETAGLVLGIGRGSAYGAARRGEIPTLRIGNRLVVPVPRLLQLIGATQDATSTS